MDYNTPVFQKQFPLVKWFIYHLMYYRELRCDEARFKKSPFWVFTTDAHLLQATNYWCMVFGSHASNPTHWKHLAVHEGDQKELRQGFKKAVLAQTGFTEEEWTKYWKEMVTFRNKYVVHRDNFKDPVPNFDIALEVVYAYDGWIRIIFPGHWQEPPLKKSTQQAKQDVRVFIDELMKA
jgi:hypothetical protein